VLGFQAGLDTLVTIIAWLSTLVFCLYAWDLVVSLGGLLPLGPAPGKRGGSRFAVLVCAHNEERVVAAVVKSLRAQDYDPEQFRIYVVADHCSDRTAEVAREAGAIAFERRGETGRTKGYALQWGIQRVKEAGTHDALCVLDADNVVSRDFLSTLSGYLAEGHVAIQAYLDSKNPRDSWVTRCIATAYWMTNRFWFRARAKLGIPATLGGTGFCLKWEIVERYPWDPGSLADDLELTMKLILDGVPVSYCYHTRTFDEKPTTLGLSFRQRSRWMQGHNDVAFRWLGPVFKAFVRKPSAALFDALLHLLQPLRMVLAFACLLLLALLNVLYPEHPAVADTFAFGVPALVVFAAIFVAYPLIVAALERRLFEAIVILVPFMLFSFSWIPAIVLGMLRFRRRVWVHTAHGQGSS
jgi:cellulose synthase/poly-beta-1,6-N-acetylglucosamine synthase-like glycosyltransferase